jgi:hypothetical protein
MTGSALALFASSTLGAQPLKHPGLLSNTTEIEFLKAKIASNQQPWKSAFDRLKAHPSASLTYTATPFAEVLCGGYNRPNQGCNDINDDGVAVYSQALVWAITGDKRYAENAIRIIDAWSAKFQKVDSSNARLVVAWAAPYYVNGAELLRLPNSGWSQASLDRFKGMLAKFLTYVDTDGGPGNNWTQSRIEAHMAIAIFQDDRTKFDAAVTRWKTWLPRYIYQKSDGPIPDAPPGTTDAQTASHWNRPGTYVDGLGMETCRDLGHLGLGFGSMMYAAEMAWHQGVDLFQPNKKRLTDFMELHAKWMMGQVQVPQNICGGVVKAREPDTVGISAPNGGGRQSWEIAYNHLNQRLGAELPTTRSMVVSLRPSGTGHWVSKWETLTQGERPFTSSSLLAKRPSFEHATARWTKSGILVEGLVSPVRIQILSPQGKVLSTATLEADGIIPVSSTATAGGLLIASLSGLDGTRGFPLPFNP